MSYLPSPGPLGPLLSYVCSVCCFIFMRERHEIPHDLMLDGLKWESLFLEKWQGFDVKTHQDGQKTVKTSELEDQDAVILGLRGHERFTFSKRVGFH